MRSSFCLTERNWYSLTNCIEHKRSGLPFPSKENNYYEFLPNKTFPLENITEIPEGKKGWVLFLDEINHAPPAIQAAAYKLVLDRMVGSHNLHPACKVIAAGNLATDKAMVQKIGSALKSRMAHVFMKTTYEEFMSYMYDNKFDPSIIGFLNYSPSNYYQLTEEFTYPAPRTWDFMSQFLQQISREQYKNITLEELQAFIGVGTGIKFKAFLKVAGNTVSISDILKDPDNTKIPESSIEKYHIASEILNVYFEMEEQYDVSKDKACSVYIKRLGNEYALMLFKGLDTKSFMFPHYSKVVNELADIVSNSK